MATTTQPLLDNNLLPFIDMTTLSLSELRTLSLFSSPPSSTTLLSHITTPTIDRSIFNESAGSRRQTYSRPSSHHHHHRHRLAGLLPKTPSPSSPPTTAAATATDPENHSIIRFLKQLLSSDPQFQELPDLLQFDHFINFAAPPPLPHATADAAAGLASGNFTRKRKRGRKPKKVKILSAEERERVIGLEIMNKNGVAVDLVALAGLEDPYGMELRRRTEGMATEEELLGFFRELGGQWCSRRKKRKIVEAAEFGDVLPVGWKLLLGLKRKDGHAWVYCRRYISPGGQQFISCKEVSAYLQSFIGPYGARQANDHAGDAIQLVHRVAPQSHAGAIEEEANRRQPNEHEKEVTLLGIENLAEVQIRDLFECHKCNMTFDEKDTYLQHLLSFHQKTTRRYRLGSSVGDGVIVKDGKYECQFCHKVFHERRRYNGHVGIHVRNYMRGIEDPAGSQMALQKKSDSPTEDDLPTRISKMDALIEIAQNSILETSSSVPNDEASGGFNPDKQNVLSNPEVPASISDCELISDSPLSESETEDGTVEKSLEPKLHQQKIDFMIVDEKMGKIDDASNVVDVQMDSLSAIAQCGNTFKTLSGKHYQACRGDEIDKSCVEQERNSEIHPVAPLSNEKICGIEIDMNLVGTDRPDHSKPDDVCNKKNIEIETGLGTDNSVPDSNIVQETVQWSFKDDVLQHAVPEPSMLLQPSHRFSMRNAILHKGENEFGTIDQKHDKVTRFEELRLEELEQLKFSFGTGQEPVSLPEVPIDLENNAGMEASYGASVESEVADVASRQQLTTVCVWCGVEFSHEALDTEMQSDSVGYMCPTCKAKISGPFNGLDGGCS